MYLVNTAQSFFGLGSQTTVQFILDGQERREMVEIPTDRGTHQLLVYSECEPVRGQVKVRPSKKVEHLGMKVELIGEIGKSSLRHYSWFSSRLMCSVLAGYTFIVLLLVSFATGSFHRSDSLVLCSIGLAGHFWSGTVSLQSLSFTARHSTQLSLIHLAMRPPPNLICGWTKFSYGNNLIVF